MTINLPDGYIFSSAWPAEATACPKCWTVPCVCNHGPTTGSVNWFTPPVDYDKIREIVREEVNATTLGANCIWLQPKIPEAVEPTWHRVKYPERNEIVENVYVDRCDVQPDGCGSWNCRWCNPSAGEPKKIKVTLPNGKIQYHETAVYGDEIELAPINIQPTGELDNRMRIWIAYSIKYGLDPNSLCCDEEVKANRILNKAGGYQWIEFVAVNDPLVLTNKPEYGRIGNEVI